MALQRGDLLHGRYRIIEILGKGGMGAIYHAVDTTLEIEVVIKENLFASEEYSEQFQREARLLATLRHPNLPRVTDYFVEEGSRQYLVMDYIEGEDLKTRLEREGKLPVAEAVIIALALCDALEYLHSREPPVIHRDIKPANVRISPEGRVYLVDFGLAKIGGGDQRTVTGAQAVTPGFSPPEQYGTAHTDPRSDIYSLGATLYNALSGQMPPDAFERVLERAELQPLDVLNPEVPSRLSDAIVRAMALEPADRYPSVSAFKEALLALGITLPHEEEMQDGWAISPPPPTAPAWRSTASAPPRNLKGTLPPEEAAPSRSRRGWRIALWLALIAAVLFGWYRLNPASLRLAAASGWRQGERALARLGVPLGGVSAPAPTPTVMFTAAPAATAGVPPSPVPLPTPSLTFSPSPSPSPSAAPTATQTPPRPTSTKAAGAPVPTPMGGAAHIAYATLGRIEAQIWLIAVGGSHARQLTTRPGGACQPAWAPDGRRLAFIAPCRENKPTYPNAQIYWLDLATQKISELTPPEWGGFDPAISPDGHWLAFTSIRTGSPRVYLFDLKKHHVRPLWAQPPPNLPASFAQPAWSPDGRYLAFVDRTTSRVWIAPFDPKKGSFGAPFAFSRSGNRVNAHPVWAGNGRLLVYAQTDHGSLPYLVKAPLDQNGLQEIPIRAVGMAMREPSVSPDGRMLVVEGWKGANHDIYIISIDGTHLQRVFHSPAQDFDPAWQPSPPP